MAFDFNETVVLTMPNVKGQYKAFKESDHRESNKLIVEIAAIHVGLTSNFNMYSREALDASLRTWVDPYPRPVILNHDQFSETIGRVMASRMTQESDGTDYVRLQAAITDPLAVERVLDERYLTGSVGGGANKALCSICSVDWASDESAAAMNSGRLPCKHRRGSIYEGKLAYFDLQDIKFKEYSFVNMPADELSGVRAKGMDNATAENVEGDWTHTVRMYSLNMNKPSVVEMSESDGVNLLDGMRRKEAQATYTNLKGTFLSVSAYDCKEFDEENGETDSSAHTIDNDLVQDLNNLLHHNLMKNSHKEKDMATNAAEEIETQDEDILAVSEQLATDLANVEVTDEVTENETSEEEATEATDELSEEDEKADPVEEEAETEEGKEDDEEEEEEQLVTSEDDVTVEVTGDEQAAESETASAEGKPEAQEDSPPDVEADPTRNSAEMETLMAENAKLTEKVEKLSKALHNMLVERVVDAKISRGLVEATDRSAQITEHSTRTAASLADTLKDVSSMPGKTLVVTAPTVPTVENRSAAIGDEQGVTTVGQEEAEVTESVDPVAGFEEHMYKLLNGAYGTYETVS
jgi:hypothetical protein